MASDFPIRYFTGLERGPMNMYYGVKAGETFKAGALLLLDTATGLVEEAGADPALIAGKAAAAAAMAFLYDNRIPVEVITSDVEYGLAVSGTLAATDAGVAYGIVKLASGNWAIDLSDTTATRVHVIRPDVTNQIAWVKFMAANLQLDGVAS